VLNLDTPRIYCRCVS